MPTTPDPRGSARVWRGRLLAAAGACAAALGTAAFLVLKPYLAPADYDGEGSGTVTVAIPVGASAQDVGRLLAEAGVVASARSFANAAQEAGRAGSLHPGHYRLRRTMAAARALDLLTAPGSRVVTRVTVPEGLRLTEVLTLLAKATGIPREAFLRAEVNLPPYAGGLEGYLFPATYEFEPGASAAEVLQAMADRFAEVAAELRLAERAAAVRLTPAEVVTVAAIVQAEGGSDADYPRIARVIYNRLKAGRPLEMCSTVLYAQRRHTLRLTEADTRIASPYNTYRHRGLPPGPIAHPGRKALTAALDPAEGRWLWFVTTNPAHRITKFTDKESDFVRYREELNEYLGKG
ncbi:endolytic transglycosylase MltG [Thermoactinospora rubra]|uniref:endolytic transglycosylase MltG n=1 Tax=Thermoactinospora rubra TaxID=1088767 RepID=UPI000A11F323|nr:endolytic transglycosylase MltG [Thermoactinospora rubra]